MAIRIYSTANQDLDSAFMENGRQGVRSVEGLSIYYFLILVYVCMDDKNKNASNALDQEFVVTDDSASTVFSVKTRVSTKWRGDQSDLSHCVDLIVPNRVLCRKSTIQLASKPLNSR
jgi:hypothetical protein